MNTKSVLVALSVIATLTLGAGLPVGAKSNQNETNTDARASKTSEKPVEKDVTVVVQAGDTLEKIAVAHDTTYVRLFNATPSIANPDQIDVGDKVTIPAKNKELTDRFSQLTAVIAQSAPVVSSSQSAPTAYTTQQYTSAPVNSSSYQVAGGMWCTDYVHAKRPDVAIYGNAGYNWIGSAQAAGKATGSAARPGAVAVTNGHVAYVESVNSDGSYVVSEMGWNYTPGQYNKRTVQPGAFGQFIY